MFPQLIDSRFGTFKQYYVNGLMTVGLTRDVIHECYLLIDPAYLYRYVRYWVNGEQYPVGNNYFVLSGIPAATRHFTLDSNLTVPISKRIGASGFIHVQLLRGKEQHEEPALENVMRRSGEIDTEIDFAEDVPERLVAVANFFIRLSLWDDLEVILRRDYPTQEVKQFLTPSDN